MQMRSSAESLQVRVDLVKTVVAKHFFKLTVEKSEVVYSLPCTREPVSRSGVGTVAALAALAATLFRP